LICLSYSKRHPAAIKLYYETEDVIIYHAVTVKTEENKQFSKRWMNEHPDTIHMYNWCLTYKNSYQ